MKVEVRLFAVLAAFFYIVGGIYTTVSGFDEPAGAVGLLLTGTFSLMCCGYLWWTARKLDPRPDDNPGGNIEDISGNYGFFSPHSWWPITLAAGCGLLAFGAAVGWWWIFFSFPVLLIGVVGWTFEYFRGPNSI